ncbi:LytR/AlgR family response regulator transcription factor [Paenibacillus whitsoniae]|uniref:Response regulator transcription factor n=1 Tax=Paenibacillus whitsoniae TaxID=2496558 RepID=A0A3S0A759_9BACL|nr:LytTR family DNA-binding domain-containing protein [Paenibacillus whitsoniae]RTE11208.1 response regulator transcription factor [Paenibacillus whitsoniae]
MASVVIAEDNNSIAQLLVKLCESNNLTVLDVVSSGGSLVSSYMANLPDIIVLDISLEGLDGITAIEILHQQGFIPEIIVVSGSQDLQTIISTINTLQTGYFISKPFHELEFNLAVERAINRLNNRHNASTNEILIKDKGLIRVSKIHENQIVYVKREAYHTKIHMVGGRINETTSKLEELAVQSEQLFSPYQSYLVNKQYIQNYEREKFKVRGYFLRLVNTKETIPISRDKLKKLKAEFQQRKLC